MSISIPELAKKLSISSQAVQQRMRNVKGYPNFVHDYTSKPHRTRIISDKGLSILFSNSKIKSKSKTYKRHSMTDRELINQLRDDLKAAHQHDDRTYKQLIKADEQIKKITLNSSQLLKTLQQTQNLLQKEQSKTKLLKYQNNTQYKQLKSRSHKHGFFYRLFH